MIRLSTFVFVLASFATAAFAADPWSESNPRDVSRELKGAPHMILTPRHPLTPADRAALLEKGVEVQSPLGSGRYLARVKDRSRAADDTRIESLAPMNAEQKILRSALRAAGKGRTWNDVTVLFHKDVTFEEARQAILSSGGALIEIFNTDFGPAKHVEARISPASMTVLASDDRVLAIGAEPRMHAIPHNAVAARISHVDTVHAAPYSLTGAGQMVMVSELAEAQATHVEFGGRLVVPAGSGTGEHSTHVSGTIAAQGIRADAKGMAPAVQVQEFDVGGSIRSHTTVLKEQLPVLKPVTNNTSLGFPLGWCSCEASKVVWLDAAEYYGAYDPVATAVYDDITRDYGTLLVFSAGNDGNYPGFGGDPFAAHLHTDDEGEPDETKTYCYTFNGSGTDCPATCTGGCETAKHHLITPFDTMTVTGSGKNVLAVGAVQTSFQPMSSASFSSRGPAKDGRVKPDVVARGQSVLSTFPGNAYQRLNGTSMAAPVVSGIAALLGEQWQKTFGRRATPAELKAIILAGAQDIGEPGPDYTYGFGLIDAKASADFIRGDGQIGSTNINQGTRFQRQITVTAAQPLKVLVSWPDPSVILLEDDAFTAKALVNDLDMQVVAPDGTVHRPYVLDKAHHTVAATRGVNTVDNAELVEIANATPGIYKVFIDGTNVPAGPQQAFIVSNAKGVNIQPCVDVQEPNDSAAAAFGNVSPGHFTGGICTAGDVDFFKFIVTRSGPVSATITSGDTALRAAFNASNGQTATVDIPADSTRTVSMQYGTGNGQAAALNVTLKVEATGTLGNNPRYDAELEFGQFAGPRHRSAKKP